MASAPPIPEDKIPDAQDIADAVYALVKMPAGQRPLRMVVGTLMVAGVESLNEAYLHSKQQYIDSIDK